MLQTMVDAIKCALIHMVHISAAVTQGTPKMAVDAKVKLT